MICAVVLVEEAGWRWAADAAVAIVVRRKMKCIGWWEGARIGHAVKDYQNRRTIKMICLRKEMGMVHKSATQQHRPPLILHSHPAHHNHQQSRPPRIHTNTTSCSLAPYERRVIELLRNSKDKRARKLAKKRVRFVIQHIGCYANLLIYHDSSVLSVVRRERWMR